MNALDANLSRRITAFREILLKTAMFDEADCVGLAAIAPKLCDSAYRSTLLRHAARIAAQVGFPDVSSWITAAVLREAPTR